MTTYRFGIIGLSWITSEPANPGSHPVLGTAVPHTHLSGLANIPAANVVAGCDIDSSARQLFLDRWAGTWPDAKVYDDYNAMLQDVPLDIVCVATPDNLHAPVVKAAAAAGVRAIFCEKPMSTHTDEIDEMIAATESRGIVVNVNHTRRWMPQYVAAREVIRDGAVGELVQILAHFGGERAMLWRNHSHLIDLISYFAEGTPTWVVGELEPGFEKYGTRYHGDGGRDASLEPSANAYIGFDNGVRAFLSGMKRGVPMLSIELIGTTARVFANDQQAILYNQTEGSTASIPIVPRGTIAGMQAAVLDLINALETGEAPQCPPSEARKAVAIIEGILSSQANGNARMEIS
ncbi:Gfo/Idh/MocA family oxidoreductase [soil metagenome]